VLLHLLEADAAGTTVDHGHGPPVVRAEALRLPEGQRDAGATVQRARAWPLSHLKIFILKYKIENTK
jgi:hypothetical protein